MWGEEGGRSSSNELLQPVIHLLQKPSGSYPGGTHVSMNTRVSSVSGANQSHPPALAPTHLVRMVPVRHVVLPELEGGRVAPAALNVHLADEVHKGAAEDDVLHQQSDLRGGGRGRGREAGRRGGESTDEMGEGLRTRQRLTSHTWLVCLSLLLCAGCAILNSGSRSS